MGNFHLLLPMFALFLLTCVVLGVLFRARLRAVSGAEVDPRFYKTFRGAEEPEHCVQLSRNFNNLCEAPLLFYVICLAAMVFGQTGWLVVLLAWLYVLLRYIHSYIHTRRNSVMPRVRAYFASWAVLAALWVTVLIGAAPL